jgi:hypothetical protein
MPYYYVQEARLVSAAQPPLGAERFASNVKRLLPPLVTALHRSFRGWGDAGFSPGAPLPERIWFGVDGQLAFHFDAASQPQPLLQVGAAPDLAAWLVLLDKYMETFVVIARARTVWSADELAGALTFTTPAFLPRALVKQWPENWPRVASALAQAVADGALVGASQDRHWQ